MSEGFHLETALSQVDGLQEKPTETETDLIADKSKCNKTIEVKSVALLKAARVIVEKVP